MCGAMMTRVDAEQVDGEHERLEGDAVDATAGWQDLASPCDRPSMASGSMRESMQVTTATPLRATPSRPLWEKSAAYAALAAMRSSSQARANVAGA